MPAHPIYKIFNGEIGTFVQWFQHDETEGQIEAALTCFTYPRGHAVLLMEDGTEDDYVAAMAQWEDLRPLTQAVLSVVR